MICTIPRPALAGNKSTLALRGGAARFVLQAERLQYRPGLGRILLSGKVTLAVGDLKLAAREVTVMLDRRGRPTRVEARGQVRFSRGPSKGTSGSATLVLGAKKRKVALEGNPRLSWAPLGLTLEGQRIEVDLLTGRLNVQRARACLSKGGQKTAARANKPSRPAEKR